MCDSCRSAHSLALRLTRVGRYVLAVDGATAAYRFAFLMQTNSVVLKQVCWLAREWWCSATAGSSLTLPPRQPGLLQFECDLCPFDVQVTDKMEWYYRAVQLCEHYLPFWVTSETDVVQLVQQLQGNHANDLVAQHIAANSQVALLLAEACETSGCCLWK